MRVFVTGASGFIGSAVVPELIGAGHEVIGLARSDEAAEALSAAGAAVHRGSLEDLDSLRTGTADADGVIHLAYRHDFSDMAAFEESANIDLRAIEAIGEELAGSDRPLVIASGALGLRSTSGGPATEMDVGDPASFANRRRRNEHALLALSERGVRSSSVRLSPTVHGQGDQGFVATMIGTARDRGVSGYVGDGSNHWPAVHRLDAATLFRLAVEQAPAGSALHGVAEDGILLREVAEAIGRHLDVPVEPVAPERAMEHFGFLGAVLSLDAVVSSELTRERLGWQPTHAGLIADLDEGHYFDDQASAA
jgi:nucleoside-diphosphate-sugar epimerase